MEVIRDLEACPAPAGGTGVTIGAYDGLHLGHRAVIEQVRAHADARGLRSALVTFDRHPAAVVRPESAPKVLTDIDQKLELLAATGIDYVLVVHFDEPRSKEPPEEFVREILVGCLAARLVVVGEDFHFGHQRRGTTTLLREQGAELGFEVETLELVRDTGGRGAVSSTAIRTALAHGQLAEANRMLGRPHEVRGTVVPGDRRGRELGFPTANVAVDADRCLPADGIYAGWYERPDGSVHPAALSLGTRPTFYDEHGALLLEAHLLGFDGELYGEEAKVRFVARIRGQERFDTADALADAIAADCRRAAELLGR